MADLDQEKALASPAGLRDGDGEVRPAFVEQVASVISADDAPALLALAGAFGGGLIGIGLVLWMELAHRRVRSAADLVQVLDLPVLGRVGDRGGAGFPRLAGRSTPLSLGHQRSP